MKKQKKTLALLLATVLVFGGMSSLAAYAYPTPGDTNFITAGQAWQPAEITTDDGVTLTKKVTSRSGPDEWQMELTFETKQLIKPTPIEVAFVLDVSQSMDDRPDNVNTKLRMLKNATESLLDSLSALPNVSVSFTKFRGTGVVYQSGGQKMLPLNASTVDGLKTAILGWQSGATNPYGTGTSKGNTCFLNDNDIGSNTNIQAGILQATSTYVNTNATRYMIVVSDGEANTSNSGGGSDHSAKAIAAARAAEMGANVKTVFAVGMNFTSDTLRGIATGSGDLNYYTTTTAGDLITAFEAIASNVSAMVVDKMGPDFRLPAKGDIAVSFNGTPLATNQMTINMDTANKTFSWFPLIDITPTAAHPTTTIKITYPLELASIPMPTTSNNGVFDDRATNASAALKYSIGTGAGKEKSFPEPTVRYETGVLNVQQKLGSQAATSLYTGSAVITDYLDDATALLSAVPQALPTVSSSGKTYTLADITVTPGSGAIKSDEGTGGLVEIAAANKDSLLTGTATKVLLIPTGISNILYTYSTPYEGLYGSINVYKEFVWNADGITMPTDLTCTFQVVTSYPFDPTVYPSGWDGKFSITVGETMPKVLAGIPIDDPNLTIVELTKGNPAGVVVATYSAGGMTSAPAETSYQSDTVKPTRISTGNVLTAAYRNVYTKSVTPTSITLSKSVSGLAPNTSYTYRFTSEFKDEQSSGSFVPAKGYEPVMEGGALTGVYTITILTDANGAGSGTADCSELLNLDNWWFRITEESATSMISSPYLHSQTVVNATGAVDGQQTYPAGGTHPLSIEFKPEQAVANQVTYANAYYTQGTPPPPPPPPGRLTYDSIPLNPPPEPETDSIPLNPPMTGDTASSLGLLMIVLAGAFAGVVLYKRKQTH